MNLNIFLLKYRIKNNDRGLIFKVKLTTFLVILIIFLFTIYIFKPTDTLASILDKKRESYATNSVNKYSFQNSFKESNDSRFALPANGIVTSNYGMRNDPISGKYSKHTGIDVSCYTHRDDIYSVADGIVTFVGNQNGYGNSIEIKHEFKNETIYSFYAHLSKIKVKVNDSVSKGQVIGNEGGQPGIDPNIGNSTGHHLHFELRKENGYDIDPTFIF